MSKLLSPRDVVQGAVVLLCLSAATARGQSMPLLPPPDNAVRSRLSTALSQLQQARYAEACSNLQEILDLPEDAFDPENPGKSFRARVEQVLAGLPPEGREAYERRYGDAARARLAESGSGADLSVVADVARRYFLTETGLDAALLLAARLSDAGQMLAAAQQFDRAATHPALRAGQRRGVLLRAAVCWWIAGHPETAGARLEAWSGEESGRPEESGITAGNATTPHEVLQWLSARTAPIAAGLEPPTDEVRLVRSVPGRNGRAATALPAGEPAWRYPLIDEYDDYHAERVTAMAAAVDGLQRRLTATGDGERVLLPAGVPLVTDDVAVMRGYGTLKAVSLETGRLLWATAAVEEGFKYLMGEWKPDENWHPDNVDLLLGQRAWRDQTTAGLSTDGTCVYAISDGGIVSTMGQTVVTAPNLMLHPLAPHTYNRLMAYELRYGRLKWERGGPKGQLAQELSGVYFLGPPLPLEGRLYCLAEDGGQVRLVVLDPRSGELLWSQPLYNPRSNLSNPLGSMHRRLAGLSPAAHGGLLICPTGEYSVVAIDLLTRQLRWQYQYREPDPYTPQRAMAFQIQMRQQQGLRGYEQQLLEQLLEAGRWHDAVPVIAGDSVLITSPESDKLHCLRLLDGTLSWEVPRDDALYVACVHEHRVILVGQESVRALSLADGTPAWETPLPIPPPSGRGYRHGHWYVLPLSTGEIATIDLPAGRLIARARTPDHAVPGNLVCGQGRVLWQDSAGVTAYRDWSEVVREYESRLAADPNDGAALALRGETRLHLGDADAALADLRRSLDLADGSRTREILAAALIEGLRTDFAAYRSTAPEINRIVDDPAQRLQFLRLYAEGLQRAGDVEEAYAAYLRFAAVLPETPELERIDARRDVRTDRWVRAQLDSLLKLADAGARGRMLAAFGSVVDQALAAGDAAAMQRLLPQSPDKELANQVRSGLARQLSTIDRAAELELHLLALDKSNADELRAFSAARRAELYAGTGERELFQSAAQRLERDFGDVVCLHGRTGQELLADWRNDPARAELLTQPARWPTARIEVDDQTRVGPTVALPVRVKGPRSEVLDGWTWFMETNSASLQALNPHGTQKWSAPPGVLNSIRSRRGGDDETRFVTTLGRLALLATEDQFTILDVLSGRNAPVILANEQFQPQAMQRQALGGGLMIVRRGAGATGVVGPLTPSCVAFQVGNRLAAIDPLSGAKLWSHETTGRPEQEAALILGDEQFVIVWPKSGDDVAIYSAADGALVATRKLLPDRFPLRDAAAWGRRLIRYLAKPGTEGLEVSLALYDPVDDTVDWERTFAGTIDWRTIDGEDLYVLRKDGTLHVVDGSTGEDRLVVRLPAEHPLERVAVQRNGDHYFVATFRTPDEPRQSPAQVGRDWPAVNGPVYSIDAGSGEVLWSQEVAQQQWMSPLPGEWPILAFVTQRSAAPAEGGRPGMRSVALTILDRDTGRVLYDQEKPGPLDKAGWKSEPSAQRMSLFAGSASVALQCVQDAPAPPEEGPPE